MSEEVKTESESETKESLKVKKKPSLKRKESKIFKVNLKEKENAVPESSTAQVDVEKHANDGDEMGETHLKEQETPLEAKKENLIKSVESTPTPSETPVESKPTIIMPEGVKKLINFMEDTGGGLEDYVRLNVDYSTIQQEALLKEFYKKTKPHLNEEEVNFVLEDKFAWKEDEDSEKDIRKKKLAMKEEVAEAHSFMNDLKEQYYEDIKLKSNQNPEQQKAVDFFNRYNTEQDAAKQRREVFKQDTTNYFTKDFEGFDFRVGENSFKYGVSNPNDVADKQTDLTSFTGKFLDKEGNVKDTAGYHKALYAARHVDTIAEHFYEQGKADAIKNMTSKSNNVSATTRQTQSNGEIFINGLKVKAISGIDSSRLKIKKRQ